MSLLTDNTRRFCSRCRLPLEDAASRECGVGPVCRKKDNHLFAKTIPANYAVAQAIVMGIPADGGGMFAPETVGTWAKARKSFMRIASKVLASNESGETFRVTGGDTRKIVTALDFMCSYSHPDQNARTYLTNIVDALGYVGLAGVLSGVASTSKSRIWFENGRVYMEGLNNTSGWRAMGAIPGVERPTSRYRKTPYSCPAASAQAFLDTVRRFWPMYEGDEQNILAQAQQWVSQHPVVAAQNAASTQAVNLFEITLRTQDFKVTFPWVRGKNMYGLINQFKAAIPADQRSYDAASKSWCFRMEQLATVRRIAMESGIFGDEWGTGIVEQQSNDLTPEGLYRSAQERREGARAQGRAQTYHSAGRGFYGYRSGWRAR